MKIAILSPWTVKPTSIGGTERFVIDLAESFINANNEVDVYMLSGDSYIKNKVNYISMNLFKDINEVDEYFLKSQFNQFNDEQSFENLAKKIEDKISFDTYDLIQLNSQLFLKVAEEKTRIFTIHTNPFEYKLDWGEISFEIMLKLMYKESTMEKTYFVTPSKYYANLYKDLSNTNIYFIPHAIDVSRITSDNDRNQILDKMNIEQNKKIILLPSRLEPIQKQPMLFMKAFALLDDNIKSNYKVICTGKDKQYEQYMDDILNLKSHSEEINYKDNMLITNSDSYYLNTNYKYEIDNNMEDDKIKISGIYDDKYLKMDKDSRIEYKMNVLTIYGHQESSVNLLSQVIKDLKNNIIRNYDFGYFDLKITANENTINKLMDNLRKLYNFDYKKENNIYEVYNLEYKISDDTGSMCKYNASNDKLDCGSYTNRCYTKKTNYGDKEYINISCDDNYTTE
mgnify:CR=1 FL=1